jgi:hypothetical protein
MAMGGGQNKPKLDFNKEKVRRRLVDGALLLLLLPLLATACSGSTLLSLRVCCHVCLSHTPTEEEGKGQTRSAQALRGASTLWCTACCVLPLLPTSCSQPMLSAAALRQPRPTTHTCSQKHAAGKVALMTRTKKHQKRQAHRAKMAAAAQLALGDDTAMAVDAAPVGAAPPSAAGAAKAAAGPRSRKKAKQALRKRGGGAAAGAAAVAAAIAGQAAAAGGGGGDDDGMQE